MKELNGRKIACGVFVLWAAAAVAVPAQTLTTLVTFEGTNGMAPEASLAQGPDGNLYGTTSDGGNLTCTDGCGTVFAITPSGTLTTLFSFNSDDGASPEAGLSLALGSETFYGTTVESNGVIFKINLAGVETTLHKFNYSDGAGPYGGLLQGNDGRFYGTTEQGGSGGFNCNGQTCGTVYAISSAGMLTTLHNFDGTDGGWPFNRLVQGSDGNFYGTTLEGGTYGRGTFFRINSDGSLTSLYSFGTAGTYPSSGLVQASDGNFYGTTDSSPNSFGTVYKITPKGQLTTLHTFNGSDGSGPEGTLVLGTDGNLYGTTESGGSSNSCGTFGNQSCGTIFRITLAGELTNLHSFDNADGSFPYGGLIQATNGMFYGTTSLGGDLNCQPSYGCGTVFSLDVGLGPFVTFVRFAGKVGQTGPILGQGFTGTTNVAIKGIQANFTVVSDTLIRATVPVGATTGYVTVTTPSGVLTSNVPFHVIP